MDRATCPGERFSGRYRFTRFGRFWCTQPDSHAKILRLSEDLPIVIEIVDTLEKIEAFLPLIDDAIKEGLATLEKVRIRFYRSGDKAELGALRVHSRIQNQASSIQHLASNLARCAHLTL